MATHSSILAWRIPGMREHGGLPSMQSHRVGHDWSDLAVAAAGCQDEWTGGSSKKLASTGGEGMSRLWCCPKYHFSHKHWARYPETTMSQSWCQSSVTDTCNPTVHMTDTCVSLNPEDTWGHTPPGLQIFPGRRTLGWQHCCRLYFKPCETSSCE